MNKKSLFFWFVAFVCAALIFTGCPQEADDDDTVTPGTASFEDVKVDGEKGVELTGVDMTVTITGDKIDAAITANDDLLDWITGAKPAWLTATAKEDVAVGAASVVITIGGIPAAASSEVLGLKIPAAALAGGADITATGKITLAVTYPAADAAATLATSSDLAGKATVSGATVTLTDDVSVTEALAIPDGVTLVVPANKEVTVSSNVTVNVGTGSAVEVSGTYNLGSNVTGENNGTVTVKPGGEIKNGTGVNIGGSGTNVVEVGGKVYFNGSLTPYIGDNESSATYQLDEGATFAFNNSGYVISGEVTLNIPGATSDENKSTWVGDGLSLHIEDGGTLTIAQYNHLDIASDDSGPVVTGGTNAQIVATGYIIFFENGKDWSADISDVPNVNFYTSEGTKETNNNGITGKTYKWDAAAGGEGKPGWKAQAPVE